MHVAVDGVHLQETNAMYEALVSQVPAVVYVNAEEEVSSALYMSSSGRADARLHPGGVAGRPQSLGRGCSTPNISERVLAEANRTRTTGDPFEAEYQLVARDGRTVRVHDKAVRVEVGDRSTVVWQGVLLDTTERKRAEEELRRSKELFRETFESAGVGMAHVTPDGRWLRVNDNLCGDLRLRPRGAARDALPGAYSSRGPAGQPRPCPSDASR